MPIAEVMEETTLPSPTSAAAPYEKSEDCTRCVPALLVSGLEDEPLDEEPPDGFAMRQRR